MSCVGRWKTLDQCTAVLAHRVEVQAIVIVSAKKVNP